MARRKTLFVRNVCPPKSKPFDAKLVLIEEIGLAIASPIGFDNGHSSFSFFEYMSLLQGLKSPGKDEIQLISPSDYRLIGQYSACLSEALAVKQKCRCGTSSTSSFSYCQIPTRYWIGYPDKNSPFGEPVKTAALLPMVSDSQPSTGVFENQVPLFKVIFELKTQNHSGVRNTAIISEVNSLSDFVFIDGTLPIYRKKSSNDQILIRDFARDQRPHLRNEFGLLCGSSVSGQVSGFGRNRFILTIAHFGPIVIDTSQVPHISPYSPNAHEKFIPVFVVPESRFGEFEISD